MLNLPEEYLRRIPPRKPYCVKIVAKNVPPSSYTMIGELNQQVSDHCNAITDGGLEFVVMTCDPWLASVELTYSHEAGKRRRKYSSQEFFKLTELDYT